MPEFDLFNFFRMTLCVFLAIYTSLTLSSALRRLYLLFSGDDPQKEMLRVYVSYQLLTIHASRMRGDLLHIVFWLAALVILWRLHALV